MMIFLLYATLADNIWAFAVYFSFPYLCLFPLKVTQVTWRTSPRWNPPMGTAGPWTLCPVRKRRWQTGVSGATSLSLFCQWLEKLSAWGMSGVSPTFVIKTEEVSSGITYPCFIFSYHLFDCKAWISSFGQACTTSGWLIPTGSRLLYEKVFLFAGICCFVFLEV